MQTPIIRIVGNVLLLIGWESHQLKMMNWYDRLVIDCLYNVKWSIIHPIIMDKRLYIMFNILVEQLNVVDDILDNHGNTVADCAERSQNNELAKWIRRKCQTISLIRPEYHTKCIPTSTQSYWVVIKTYSIVKYESYQGMQS